jgi:dTDP-4-amino-4,6-dideoxygalactose transaminase
MKGAVPSAYEQEAARRLGSADAIAFAFARHALAAGLDGLGAEPGDEIILSPLTCKIVPITLLAARLIPVYADIVAETLNLDPRRVNERIGVRTRAILFQHTYGGDAGIQAVAEVAARHGRALLEDCAQCLPLGSHDYTPGRLGRAAVFSCNLMKPLPAGSGGLLTTNDEVLAARVRAARDRLPERPPWTVAALRIQTWAQRRLVGPRTYWPVLSAHRFISARRRTPPVEAEIRAEFSRLAFRPSAFQLIEGLHWMRRIDAIADHRRLCCAEYEAALSGRPGLATPVLGARPLLYFPVLAPRKPALLAAARRQHLQMVSWPGSTPIYPVERAAELSRYGYQPGACPVAETVAGQLVGLPTEVDVTASHRRRLIELVASWQ